MKATKDYLDEVFFLLYSPSVVSLLLLRRLPKGNKLIRNVFGEVNFLKMLCNRRYAYYRNKLHCVSVGNTSAYIVEEVQN